MRRVIVVLLAVMISFGATVHAALTANGNGTVTDSRTGLIWQQGEPGAKDWGGALSYCENLSLGSSTSWRLPNVKELESLTDDTRWNPSIDTALFPDAVAPYYWSSTSCAGNPGSAWIVDCGGGSVSSGPKGYAYYVRCAADSLGHLNPTIAMTPMAAPAGTTFAQWGTGFAPNGTATMHFKKPDGTEYPTSSQPLDAIGHFDILYASQPDKPAGFYTWWAVDDTSGEKSNEVVYEITAPPGQRGLSFMPDSLNFGTVAPGSSTYRYTTLYNDSDLEVQVYPLTIEGADLDSGLILQSVEVNGRFYVASFPMPPHAKVSVKVDLSFSGEPQDGTWDAVLKARESGGTGAVATAYLQATQGDATTLDVTLVRGGRLIRSIKGGGLPQQGYYGDAGKITETAISDLSAGAIPPVGVVADGNSRLFVVARTNAAGLVEFRSPEGTFFLEPLDRTSGGDLVRVPTVAVSGGYQATAVLIAPDDYPGSGASSSREIKVALYTDTSGVPAEPAVVSIRRAPVVLIHGLWASKDSWYDGEHGVGPVLRRWGYPVGYFEYENFRGPSESMKPGQAGLRGEIASLCNTSIVRDRHECTRADLVAHSMGGLVARKYIKDNNYYRTAADYNQGSVRRLLTLATPHSGSGYADFLMGQTWDIEYCIVDPIALGELTGLVNAAKKLSCGLDYCSAIKDLQLGDENTLLENLNEAPQEIPTYAFIGDCGTDFFLLDALTSRTGCSHQAIFHQENADQIVPVSSAAGGLPGGATKTFDGICHTGMGQNDEIATAVREKLDGSVSAFTAQIQPDFAAGVGAASGSSIGAKDLRAAGTAKSLLASLAAASAAMLTLEASATTLPPGGTLVLTATHDGAVAEAMILTDGSGNTWTDEAEPWEWILPIPVSAAGVRTYKAVASIDGETAESNTVEVTILPEMAGLEQLDFSPAEQMLLFQGLDEQLVLLGKFADNETRDITHPALGTTYHERIVDGVVVSEGDSPVLDVTAAGKVTALEPGTADVVAVNGAVTTVRRFIVVERPPTVAEARDDTATTEANHAVTIDVLDNDIGEGALEVTEVSTPGHGSATYDGTTVTYTPSADWSGTDQFTYTLTDAISATATGTITVTVQPGPAALIVVSPVTWEQGSRQTISWRGTVATGKVRIQLFRGAALKATITPGTSNDGAFEWTVPPTLPVGSNYKIKVSWLGNPAVIKAWSDQFPVVAPTLTVGQPDGMGTVMKGSLQPIRWGGPVGGKVRIQLFQGAVLKKTIAAKTPNDGVFDWVVPTTLALGGDYLVRVTWLANKAVRGNSSALTVVATTGALEVTQPDGAAAVEQGEVRQILWSGIPLTGKVKVRLYRETVLKATISTGTPNDGTFDWKVPSTLVPGDYTVRVTWLSDIAFTDESATFTVVAPAMTVNQPAGGATWDQKTTQDVTWSCGKGFGNVKIELYKGAVLFKTLAASTPNTGVKTITVPAVRAAASNYRVKITWLTNPRVSGWSTGFITLQ